MFFFASPPQILPLATYFATYFGHELWFVPCVPKVWGKLSKEKKRNKRCDKGPRPMTHKVHTYHLWYVYLAKWNILWAKSDDIYIYIIYIIYIYYIYIYYIYIHVIANQLVQLIILVPEVDHSIAIIWDYCNFHIVQLVFQRCTVLLSNNFLAGSAFLPKRVDHEFHCINIKTESLSCSTFFWKLSGLSRRKLVTKNRPLGSLQASVQVNLDTLDFRCSMISYTHDITYRCY